MQKDDIAQRVVDVLNDLRLGVSRREEIESLQPPLIGEWNDNEELIAVTDESITQELPVIKDTDDDDPTSYPDLAEEFEDILPEGIFDILGDAERIREECTNQIPSGQLRPINGPIRGMPTQSQEICAWYAPIHYFGKNWGIYIREACLKSMMLDVLWKVDWGSVHHISTIDIVKQVRNACFYYLYFHEQFHHKVESLGFRSLLTTQSDIYRNYKAKVYRSTYPKSKCLEESLANAEAFLRFDEERYKKRLHRSVIKAIRAFAEEEWYRSDPDSGYRQAHSYKSRDSFRNGLWKLHCQFIEGAISPKVLQPSMWDIAPRMISGLMNIKSEIYTIVNKGSSSVFSSAFDPKHTTSTQNLGKALTKHYGYEIVNKQGKGSHEKYRRHTKNGTSTIILSGNRRDLPLKDIKDAIEAVTGSRQISLLQEVLKGSAAGL